MTIFSSSWNTPPHGLRLLHDEVHVWRASLQQSLTILEQLQRFLSAEEISRADRFRFARDRDHFIIARGLLRTLLAQYLSVPPGSIRFVYNTYGKPELRDAAYGKTLSFNISHSQDIALYAFSQKRQLGVDVEYTRVDIEHDELAKHSFSPYEISVLRSLTANAKHEAFFNCWTRKEAYIKARGMGLSLSLDLFDVSLKPGEPATLLDSREDPREAQRWLFQVLEPGPGYAGALAVEGRDWKLCCWQWSGAGLL